MKGVGNGPPTAFEHPFFQTAAMFLGELMCLFIFKLVQTYLWFSNRRGNDKVGEGNEKSSLLAADQLSNNEQNSTEEQLSENDAALGIDNKPAELNPLILWIPACCDLGATTLLNVGLFLVCKRVLFFLL